MGLSEVRRIISDIERKEIASADDTALAAVRVFKIFSRQYGGEDYLKELRRLCSELRMARKSSASLQNCVSYVLGRVEKVGSSRIEDLRRATFEAADTFGREIEEAKMKIAEIGVRRLEQGDTILTHGYSTTVLSLLSKASKIGLNLKIYITEARPKLEGRQMAVETAKLGFETTIIADAAARVFMEEVDKVLVGGDAIAVNGAVVGKIGTSMIAALAHEARVRVMIALGTYKMSPTTLLGELIEIEEGDETEIVGPELLKMSEKLKARNPLHDVTPARYIDVLITEEGIFPPQGIYILFEELKDKFGWTIP